MVKCCTKCGVEKPRTKEFFPVKRERKDGLSSWCSKCANAFVKAWRKKNKEKIKIVQIKYRKTLRGHVSYLVGIIKQRCNNLNHKKYKHYGGRGIRCKFISDELYNWLISNKVDPRGLEIHRISNDGNYTLDNIEFLDKDAHIKAHSGVKYTKKLLGD